MNKGQKHLNKSRNLKKKKRIRSISYSSSFFLIKKKKCIHILRIILKSGAYACGEISVNGVLNKSMLTLKPPHINPLEINDGTQYRPHLPCYYQLNKVLFLTLQIGKSGFISK